MAKRTQQELEARAVELDMALDAFDDVEEDLDEAKKKKYSSKTITTGSVGYNIAQFNKRMGTDFSNPSTEEAKAQAAAEKAAQDAAEPSTAAPAGDAGTGDGGMAGGEGSEGGGMGESLLEGVTLDEEKILIPKLVRLGFTPDEAQIDIPDFVRLLPVTEVENAIHKLAPSEPFSVGYLNPIYFYKELWTLFSVFKCTEFEGYTGMDYRQVRDETSGQYAGDQDDRIKTAKSQIDNPEEGDNGIVKRIDNQAPKAYTDVNKIVQQHVYNNVGHNTILYYTAPGKKPKVCYYINIHDGHGYAKISREFFEQTVVAYVEKSIKNNSLTPSKRWSIDSLKKLIRKTLDSDEATTGKDSLGTSTVWEPTADADPKIGGYVNKPQVRALYTSLVYYIKTPYERHGALLAEGLQLGMFDDQPEEELTEAKRETKRYYIRPQGIFCANKAEVIRALISIGDENCSVYTLKGLDDNKDVHLLTNQDIIYYYDDGILYDKNHVKVMDYDLYIKHEEERKKFPGDVDNVSGAAFADEYDDRITDITGPGLEEAIRVLDSLDESLENPRKPAIIDQEIEELRKKIDSANKLLGDIDERIAKYQADKDPKHATTMANKTRAAERDKENTHKRIDEYKEKIDQLLEERRAYFRKKAEEDMDKGLKDEDLGNQPPKVISKSYKDIVEFLVGENASISLSSVSTKVKNLKWLLPELEDDQIDITPAERRTSGGYPMKYGVSGYIRVKDSSLAPSGYAYYFKNNQITTINQVIAILRSDFAALSPLIIKHEPKDESFAESLEEDNPFELSFESFDAFGNKLHEGKDDTYVCCICGEECTGYGNNPAPVKEKGRCCDACNIKFVIPARMSELNKKDDEE